jgi:hypothetical protein
MLIIFTDVDAGQCAVTDVVTQRCLNQDDIETWSLPITWQKRDASKYLLDENCCDLSNQARLDCF